MIERWTIPRSQQRTRHDDGHWLVFDGATGESWQVAQGVAEVLESFGEGWQPGTGLPPRLQPYGLTPTDEIALVDDLVRQGLVVDTSAPPAAVRPPRRPRLAWPIWRAPAIAPQTWRMLVMTLAAAAVAAAAHGWHQLPVFPGEERTTYLMRALRGSLQQPVGSGVSIFEILFYWVLLAGVHELAHAFALTSRTGRPTAVGLRVWGLWLRPFADVTAIVTLPCRADRLPVIAAGSLAEFAAWTVLLAALGRHVGALGLPFVLLGPMILLVNLVPLGRNDGYLLLQELTGDRDLKHTARRAAYRALLAPELQTGRVTRWWLPWYGLLELTVAPALVVPLGMLLGGLVSLSAAGAVGGLAAGLGLLAWRVRHIDVTAEGWPGANAA